MIVGAALVQPLALSRRLALAALAVALLCPAAAAQAAPQRGFVRVDQVGYPAGTRKIATLIASRPPARRTAFRVLDGSGHAVLSHRLGHRLRAWSARFPYVYALDLSRVSTPGSYTIAAAGARSGRFKIGTAAALYSGLTAAEARFFAAQHDGTAVDPAPLHRRPSHLNDQTATVYTAPSSASALAAGRLTPAGATADVSGGWFDAGDYLKLTETGSFADSLVLMATRDHAAAAPLAAEARFETEWLMRMWDPGSRVLLYQVGIGDGDGSHVIGDHDLWRLPQRDDAMRGSARRYLAHRPAFRAGPPGTPLSPNLAGRLAAAFGLCAQVYRATDPAFADRCLMYAQTIYEQARTTGVGQLLTSAPHAYYPESVWHDDMELGATEIYLAMAGRDTPAGLPHSDPNYYLGLAAHWADAYMRGKGADRDSLNLYDVSAIAHADLLRALVLAQQLGASPDVANGDLEVTRDDLLHDLHDQLAAGQRRSLKDPFRLANPNGVSDSVPHALGYTIEARLYDAAAGSSEFDAFAQRQLDWVLGANAWGSSFVVGAGRTFPHCLQHQVANLAGSLSGSGSLLTGAVVDGPTDAASFGRLLRPEGARACPRAGNPFAPFNGHGGVYADNVGSASTSEPGIDYSSLATLAFAVNSGS